MKIIWVAVVLMVASSFGCNKKAEPPVGATQKAVTPVGTSEAKPMQCPDGKTLKVYEGRCGGTWAVIKQTDGTNACVFNWGPVKECPKNSVSMGYKAVCYGTLQKPGAASTELCGSQFGNPPADTPYKLICCE